jgi:hypothetical protein
VSRDARRAALRCYNDLVGDIGKGGVDDEFDDFTDFDEYESFSVSEVATPFGRREHGVPADFTGLVVCYLYSAIAEVPTLDDGADLICAASGRLVTLIEESDRIERYWMPHPLDGPPSAPHEPTPHPEPSIRPH